MTLQSANLSFYFSLNSLLSGSTFNNLRLLSTTITYMLSCLSAFNTVKMRLIGINATIVIQICVNWEVRSLRMN
jgi:hypothetical protein